jgi:DNA invertase Pin-like site-specific DNA recombinase
MSKVFEEDAICTKFKIIETDKKMKIGYARVSTQLQNIDMQIEALNTVGCETIYQEKKSAFSERPELDNAMKSIRVGDTLCVWSFDRLGRNMLEVISNVKTIHDKGGKVYSIIQKFDTDNATGKIMLSCFSLFAEMEATLRKERAQASIAIAREKGRSVGRRKGITEQTKAKSGLVNQMYISENPVYSISQIEKQLKISKKTIYRCLDYLGVKLRGRLEIK